jgi:hypothetical protein
MNRGVYEFPLSAAHLARQVTEGQTDSPEREFDSARVVGMSVREYHQGETSRRDTVLA